MTTDTTSLNGRTAIVTGASSGIGLAIAKQLAAVGVHVFLAGRTAEPMEETKRAIEQQGGSAFVITADVRDPLQIEHLIANACLLYTSPSPRDGLLSRMPSSA